MLPNSPDPTLTRLAMDANADVHLTLAELEGRTTGRRDGSWSVRTHRAGVGVDAVVKSLQEARFAPHSAAAPTIFSTTKVSTTPVEGPS
jgi:hypothetical protein